MREPIGIISHATIGRTSSKRRDEAGIPIEETVPALRSVEMYDLDGNAVQIATHCSRAFVKGNDEKYRPRVMRDRLVDGFLEVSRCPHMPREQLDDQPSVKPPAKFTTCDGKGDTDEFGVTGCAHLKAVVAARREMASTRASLRKNSAGRAAAIMSAQALAAQAQTQAAADSNRARTRTPAGPRASES